LTTNKKLTKEVAGGVLLCLLAALCVWELAALPWNRKIQLTPLTLAILAGMLVGNTGLRRYLVPWQPGIRFSQQWVLRLGIILYGLRLTIQDLLQLGPRALLLDIVVISGVLIVGSWIGTRFFGLDSDTALLVSAGSGICGAAAVLATDRVIESDSNKVSVAVATVVVFGTLAMFLYPALFPLTGFSEHQFGIYTGATVHEVAQVVAAGKAVSESAAGAAVITKMLRVLLLAPCLLLVGRLRRNREGTSSRRIAFPWFVLGFLGVIVLQSLVRIPAQAHSGLVEADTIFLSSAMFALGLSSEWSQFKRAGARPLLLAATIFAGLVTGGFALTSLLIR
jgi:uncharacterized integral membrane protein (TIGR00698 family)